MSEAMLGWARRLDVMRLDASIKEQVMIFRFTLEWYSPIIGAAVVRAICAKTLGIDARQRG
jgi:hypothetical protein